MKIITWLQEYTIIIVPNVNESFRDGTLKRGISQSPLVGELSSVKRKCVNLVE
jgi:hypothetical protein